MKKAMKLNQTLHSSNPSFLFTPSRARARFSTTRRAAQSTCQVEKSSAKATFAKCVCRREQLLASAAAPIFLAAFAGNPKMLGTDDPTTVINSVLGAYGLPKLPGGSAFKLYDDLDEDFRFEYPRSWVGRSNSQREGVYVMDFNTADKAVVEVFPEPPSSAEVVEEVVRRAVSPASEIGGDARLIMPDQRRIKAETAQLGGTTYTYVRFPSETVTRSGYQIRRKNFAVAARSARTGLMYSLVASARSDQFNPEKEAVLQHIVQSFRIRT